jgi:hypothetical protein
MNFSNNSFATIKFKRILLVLLLGMALIFGASGDRWQALADTYQYEKTDKPYFAGESFNEKQAQNAKENAESLTEKVKDKLNLDESLPEGTKKFFKQIRGEEPIERDTPLD